MIKKIYMLTYFIVVFSVLSIGYTGSYFSDMETSSSCSLTAGIWPDCIPYKPTNPNPGNNAICIDFNPTLSVYISDPNDDIMDVYFYNAADNVLIDAVTDVESNTMVSVVWHGLDFGRTYEWYVIAEDYEGPTQSDTWTFTTNYPPDIPSLTFPANDFADVVLSPTLKVKVFDLDGDNMNVSFYDATNNQLIGANDSIADGENASIKWENLDYSTTYKWYVIINDSMTETQSPIWRFATQPLPSGGGGSSEDDAATENILPIAHLPESYTGHVFENIMFNASGTYDPDGIITNYTWDFGDGNIGYGISPVHFYPKSGIYTILLSITDNDNLIATNTTTATIKDILEVTNILATPKIQNIGEYINITCTITNTTELVDVIFNLTLPNGTCNALSIYQNNIDNTPSYYCNETYDAIGQYSFFIIANDTKNNSVISDSYQFLIGDLISPEISNVAINPDNPEINGWINITANITDNIGVKDVLINVTHPDSTTTNTSMIQTDGTSIYYSNSTFSNYGEYTLFIFALDVNDNMVKSDIYSFSISDFDPPNIIDYTPTTAYKNDTLIFNASVTDNNIVADVYVEYWNESEVHTNQSMINTNDSFWETTIATPCDQETLHYIICGRDIYGNWNHTEIININLL